MKCEEYLGGRCPCALAARGECAHCSLLGGESFCRCDWQGRCIYDLTRRPEQSAPPAEN